MDSMDLLIKIVDNRVYELALTDAKKNIENGFVKKLLSKYNVLGKLSLPKN